MAQKQANLSQGVGTPAYERYETAQKRFEDMLAERENRLFDPTLLAMAQGFLAPTKTGSFGESLGNVAGAVAPVQAAEDKRTMDMARMRLEMAQQGVQTDIQKKQAEARQSAINQELGEQSPYYRPIASSITAPPVQQPAQQPAGALPSAPVAQPPTASVLPTQAPQPAAQPALQSALPSPPQQAPQQAPAPLAQAMQAPQAPQEPSGTQLFPAQPYALNPEERKLFAQGLAANKDPYDIRKEINEERRKNMPTTTSGTTDLRTGRLYAPPDPTPTEVRLPDGTTHITTKTMAGRLAGAQASGNADEYFKIVDLIQKGMTRPTPAAGGVTPATAEAAAPATAPVGRPLSKEQEEAQAARKKEMAVGDAKSEIKRRETLPDDIKRYDSLARSADSLYEIVNKNPKGFGTFDKAGVLPAIGVLVRDGIRANKVNVDMGGWEDAIRGANPRIKDADINAVRLGAAEQANIELNYANMFLKGTGPITEGERAIVRRAGAGNVSMSPEVLKLRAQAVGKRAGYERDDLNAYREFVTKSPDATYLDYMNTPKYKSLYADYDKDMRKMAGLTSTKQQTGKPDLKAAGANVDKQTD